MYEIVHPISKNQSFLNKFCKSFVYSSLYWCIFICEKQHFKHLQIHIFTVFNNLENLHIFFHLIYWKHIFFKSELTMDINKLNIKLLIKIKEKNSYTFNNLYWFTEFTGIYRFTEKLKNIYRFIERKNTTVNYFP